MFFEGAVHRYTTIRVPRMEKIFCIYLCTMLYLARVVAI